MKHICFFIVAFLLIPLSGCNNTPDEIIACGDDQVIVIDNKSSDNDNVNILWRWKVSEAKDLPQPYKKYMVPTDDCKPVDGKEKILITSSGGGVALVGRKTGKTLFYAHVPMAHSAEYLPGDRVVVALSTAAGGNSIELYDLKKPEVVMYKDSLYSGHGVVWMEKINALFALGYNELRRYSLKKWDTETPELQLEETWMLPDNGGHDLSPVSDKKLVLSTSNNVWLFNIDNGQFIPFEPLKGVRNIKSVNFNESTGALVYTKGETSWWTHNIYFKNPDKTLVVPDINLYKVRVVSE